MKMEVAFVDEGDKEVKYKEILDYLGDPSVTVKQKFNRLHSLVLDTGTLLLLTTFEGENRDLKFSGVLYNARFGFLANWKSRRVVCVVSFSEPSLQYFITELGAVYGLSGGFLIVKNGDFHVEKK